jgi:hypothetical protein
MPNQVGNGYIIVTAEPTSAPCNLCAKSRCHELIHLMRIFPDTGRSESLSLCLMCTAKVTGLHHVRVSEIAWRDFIDPAEFVRR